ncbi:MAG: hypothetical protein AAF579_08870 [Cyanobacteria bacterium P01_C01_bin.118]
MKKLAIAGLGVGILSVDLYFGANLYGTKVAEAKVNKLIDTMAEDDLAVEYKDISYKPMAQDVHVKDVTITSKEDPAEVTIEKVVIRDIDDKSDVPKVMDVSIQGLLVDLNQPEQLEMASFLQQAGYDTELSFDIDTKYRYNEAKREMTVDNFKVSADQVGDLTVNMKLGNVDPDAGFSGMNTIFHGFEITYKDKSFAEKFLASMAADQGTSVAALKSEMTGQLTGASQFLLSSENQVVTDAVNEVVAFIEDPQGLSISVKPEEPLELTNLMAENPDDWVDQLNIEVKSF